MKDVLAKIEEILTDMWNYLYKFLCYITGDELHEEWLVG